MILTLNPRHLPQYPDSRFVPSWLNGYAERTGFSVDLLDYYVGFNNWKTAAILHGVYARYCAGQKSTEGVDMDGLREGILKALNGAERAIQRLA